MLDYVLLRAFIMGLEYAKCKENLACENQIAQQSDMETCKNANVFAIVLHCPKGRTAL